MVFGTTSSTAAPAAQLGGRVQGGGLRDARRAHLGAHHVAGVRHVDRGEDGGGIGPQRGGRDGREDAGLVGFAVDAGVRAHRERVEIAQRAPERRADGDSGHVAGGPDPDHERARHDPGGGVLDAVGDDDARAPRRSRGTLLSPATAAVAPTAPRGKAGSGKPSGLTTSAVPSSSATPAAAASPTTVASICTASSSSPATPTASDAVVTTGWAPRSVATRLASALAPPS